MQTTASVTEGQGRLGVYEEGMTQFPPSTAEAYRYKMSAVEDRLHFWLEDINSKQQWQSKGLRLEDFTTSETTIPQATFADYVSSFQNCLVAKSIDEAVEVERVTNPSKPLGETKEESAKLSMEEYTAPETVIPQAGFLDYVSCFHSCLDANIATDSSEFARDLTPHESDDWEMRLTLKIKVFLSVWTLTYSFVLKQISLEPIDVLSAKIRDQADHIKALENEIEQLKLGGQKPIEPVFVQGVTIENRPNGHKLIWKYDGEDVGFGTPRPIIFNPSGTIAVSKPGVYVIHVVAQAINQGNGAVVELLQNDKRVATTTIAIINNVASTPLHRVLSLGLEDQLAIVYKGNSQSTAGSSLVMYKLQ
ncbi:hypothetical protein Poli38472_013666 [Pythium oligandrum]|uniref:Uncharacterized protein n=1 Tax=Pythium oligandrum TaxID=41045 RepID=A0A8K1CDV6_PYTOL|nr:hypothetical protein Poli38472_013666 [Pythium oligandrum]|eukprot:TMW61203.1 hypothetical protein Poli38472_013666 [Pythium oligandrum]